MSVQRNDTIDAFRGIAILSVIAFHYLVRFAKPYSDADLYGYTHTYSPVFVMGANGVELFFFISGFVISMTALKSGGAMDFAFKRFARLYPAFVVCATFTFSLLIFHDPLGWNVRPSDYVASLTMFARHLGFNYVDGVYWSLSVEIQFYAIVACSLLFLKHRYWVLVLVVLLTGAVLGPYSYPVRKILFSEYAAFFLAGMAAWYILVAKSRVPATALGLGALFAAVASAGSAAQLPAFIASALLFACLYIGLNSTFFGLAWVGRISYPLYLIHQRVGVTLIHDLKRSGLSDALAILVVVAGSVVAAWLLHSLVELPAQRALLDQWKRSRVPKSHEPRLANIGSSSSLP